MTDRGSFEAQLIRLEAIAQQLDRSDVPLAELLDLYEEGVLLSQACRAFLAAAEQKVTEIQRQVDAAESMDAPATDWEEEGGTEF